MKIRTVGLGILLVAVPFFAAIVLLTVGVGYLAVRGHFDEIPLSRSGAIAMSSFVATGVGVAWLTLGTLGYALGQVAGNGNLGTLLGGLIGIVGWVVTTVAYGSRITKGLAEIYVMMRPATNLSAADRVRTRARWLTVIFVATAALVGIALYTALQRSYGP